MVKIRNIYLIIYCLLFFSCAAIKSPSGGPVDIIPPQLIRSDPPAGTTLWEGGSIRLYFSEYMNKNNLEKAFKISPELNEDIEIEFYGDVIEILIKGVLEYNRTYILTINRDLKDEHGIPMEQGNQIAFSTGKTIDKGEISGRVYGQKNISVHLWLYNQKIDRDSIYFSPPHYVTDAKDDGNFSFKYLSSGEYCILAIGRENSGQPFGKNVFRAGIPNQSIISLNTKYLISNVFLKMNNLKKTVKLKRSEFVNKKWGKLFFDGDITNLSNKKFITIFQEGKVLKPNLFLDPEDNNNLIFTIDSIYSNLNTTIKAEMVRNGQEILLDSALIKANVPDNIDTTYLKIINPKSVIYINPNINYGPKVELVLSRPVKFEDPLFDCKLTSSDLDTVKFILNNDNPKKVSIHPIEGWVQNTQYLLTLISRDTTPYNSFKDSIFEIKINVKDNIGYGNLLGEINNNQFDHLVVEGITIKNSKDKYTDIIGNGNDFLLEKIPSSSYSLLFFNDLNKDSNYSYGNVLPFQPSEYFYYYPDTIDIRANWDYELKNITIGME